MQYYLYDTCSVINLQSKLFNGEKFFISSVTFQELENIKTATYKDEEIKYKARQVLHLLEKHEDEYVIVPYTLLHQELMREYGLVDNNDARIIITAKYLEQEFRRTGDKITFVTADLACRSIARSIGLTVQSKSEEEEELYTGYQVVEMTDEELANFYENSLPSNFNSYNLVNNQYLLIKSNGLIVDKYKWKNDSYSKIPYIKVNSKQFGELKPRDSYQAIALDSMLTNKLTMVRGKAGTGKSWLAFNAMFMMLEKNIINKIIVFCNTIATKGSAKLGYYPGSRTEKLLDSQIGNLLESKIGGREEVERLIEEGVLVLLPMSDIRGYDTSGMNAAIYISEAQNMDRELMKLALQRIGEDSICILDGDDTTQVDMSLYAGENNGMKRVSKIFKGKDLYGEVTLANIYRSQIAEIADQL